MATEMAEVSNRVNFGSWVGRLTCPEKSGQREYPMISGLVRKKRYGIQCPENIGPASTCWVLTQNHDAKLLARNRLIFFHYNNEFVLSGMGAFCILGCDSIENVVEK